MQKLSENIYIFFIFEAKLTFKKTLSKAQKLQAMSPSAILGEPVIPNCSFWHQYFFVYLNMLIMSTDNCDVRLGVGNGTIVVVCGFTWQDSPNPKSVK